MTMISIAFETRSCHSFQLYYFRQVDSDLKHHVKKLQDFFKEELYASNHKSTETKQFKIPANEQEKDHLDLIQEALKQLTQVNVNSIKLMVKPNKAICLAVESLVAFFAGCEQWLPKYYNVNKQRYEWLELQKYLAHPKFLSALNSFDKYISQGLISENNFQNSQVVFEQLIQIDDNSMIIRILTNIIQELLNYWETRGGVIDVALQPFSPIRLNTSQDSQQQEFDRMININENRQVLFAKPEKFQQLIVETSDILQKEEIRCQLKKGQQSQSPENDLKTKNVCQRLKTDSNYSVISKESRSTKTSKMVGANKSGKKMKNSSNNKENYNSKHLTNSRKISKLNEKKPITQEDKKKLQSVIEQHKKLINKLHQQESMIRWRIEREAKQLAILEEDQKCKQELEWNSQQRSKMLEFQKISQDESKCNQRKDNDFRQQLRNRSISQEQKVDQSLISLQYQARRSEVQLKEQEQRLMHAKQCMQRKSGSRSPVNVRVG